MATVNQQFGGREHSSANTRLETNLHGKVEGFISITNPTSKVTSAAVFVGGSTYEVARAAPSGEAFPQLSLVLRRSMFADFEQKIRDAYGIPEETPLAPLQVKLILQIISEPYDEFTDGTLPTTVTTFSGNYEGQEGGGSDRKSNDPLEVTVYIQQTSPAVPK